MDSSLTPDQLNQDERRSLGWARFFLYLIPAIPFLSGMVTLALSGLDASQNALLLRDGTRTTGQVVEYAKWRGNASKFKDYPVVVFTTNEGQPIRTQEAQRAPEPLAGRPIPPYTVQVVYNPADPNQFHIVGFSYLWSPALMGAIAGLGLTVLGLLIGRGINGFWKENVASRFAPSKVD